MEILSKFNFGILVSALPREVYALTAVLAGQERYRALARQYYRGAHGIIIMYSVTEFSSFEDVDVWLNDLAPYITPETRILLIGNKVH